MSFTYPVAKLNRRRITTKMVSENYGISDDFDWWGGSKWDCEAEEEEVETETDE